MPKLRCCYDDRNILAAVFQGQNFSIAHSLPNFAAVIPECSGKCPKINRNFLKKIHKFFLHSRNRVVRRSKKKKKKREEKPTWLENKSMRRFSSVIVLFFRFLYTFQFLEDIYFLKFRCRVSLSPVMYIFEVISGTILTRPKTEHVSRT